MNKFMHLSLFGSSTKVSFHLHIDCKRIKIQEYEKRTGDKQNSNLKCS